jgi:citrate lyase gamma subunit
MPLSQAFELIGEQDLEDFVVLVHEFWLRYRRSDFFRNISREMLDHFFDKYGQEPLASVIEDMGVTEAMVAEELIGLLRPILERAVQSGALERLLRARLQAFYGSAAALSALEVDPVQDD